MIRERIQKSSARSSQPQESTMAPVLTQRHSPSPHTQQDTETQVIQQHNREAAVLKIQAKYGTITPQGQERLTFLQAKMADDTQRKLNFGDRTHQNSLNSTGNISVAPFEGKIAPPIQAKLTIGKPGDKYEQEADRVAAQVVKQIHAPASHVIQRVPASDWLPGDRKFSRKRPYIKKGSERGTQESEQAQQGETQQVEQGTQQVPALPDREEEIGEADRLIYNFLNGVEGKLNENLKAGELNKLKSNLETLRNLISTGEIQGNKLQDKHKERGNQIIEKFNKKIKEIEAMQEAMKKQKLGNSQEGIIEAEKRNGVRIFMGQGLAVNLGQQIVYSTDFSSCTPIVMFNQTTKIGGLFHFAAKSLAEQKPSLEKMYNDIKPTTIHLNQRKLIDISTNDTYDDDSTLTKFFKECGYSNKLKFISLGSNQYSITLGQDGNSVLIDSDIDKGRGNKLSLEDDTTAEGRKEIEEQWQKVNAPSATKYGINMYKGYVK